MEVDSCDKKSWSQSSLRILSISIRRENDALTQLILWFIKGNFKHFSDFKILIVVWNSRHIFSKNLGRTLGRYYWKYKWFDETAILFCLFAFFPLIVVHLLCSFLDLEQNPDFLMKRDLQFLLLKKKTKNKPVFSVYLFTHATNGRIYSVSLHVQVPQA